MPKHCPKIYSPCINRFYIYRLFVYNVGMLKAQRIPMRLASSAQIKGFMANQIRTLTKHENSTSSADRDQGARNWSAAQVIGPISFVVDICVEVQCQLEIKRWVTTSILEVAQIQQSHKPFQWAQVFVSMRTARSAPGGILFEEVSEVYQSGQVGSYIYRLTNGIAFMPDSRQASDEEDATFKLIYSNQQATTA